MAQVRVNLLTLGDIAANAAAIYGIDTTSAPIANAGLPFCSAGVA
jgi:hypothetical protein